MPDNFTPTNKCIRSMRYCKARWFPHSTVHRTHCHFSIVPHPRPNCTSQIDQPPHHSTMVAGGSGGSNLLRPCNGTEQASPGVPPAPRTRAVSRVRVMEHAGKCACSAGHLRSTVVPRAKLGRILMGKSSHTLGLTETRVHKSSQNGSLTPNGFLMPKGFLDVKRVS